MRPKIEYAINEQIYLPFKISEIFVNSLGEVKYTIAAVPRFMIYSQTGIAQKDLLFYGLSCGKEVENEENI